MQTVSVVPVIVTPTPSQPSSGGTTIIISSTSTQSPKTETKANPVVTSQTLVVQTPKTEIENIKEVITTQSTSSSENLDITGSASLVRTGGGSLNFDKSSILVAIALLFMILIVKSNQYSEESSN